MPHLPRSSRRTFIKGMAVTAGGLYFPSIIRAENLGSRKLNMAAIGCGGKGASDIMAKIGDKPSGSSADNEMVALCDVDEKNLNSMAAKFPGAQQFRDFREMLDKVKEIEAVTISTPDHAHFPAAMHAISLGKHVCIQKPLANNLWELRQMQLAAQKKGVITQMGNQGHTYDDNRVVKEWIAAGAIGKVKEAHVWTNRPIWPQGKNVVPKVVEVPANLDWQHWLAATPDAPFYQVTEPKDGGRGSNLHPFNWRGWLEYGAGAFGDMGCHLIDPISNALDLGVPRYVTATQCDDLTDIAWPTGAIVKMEFPKTDKHDDFVLYWYEGKKPDGTQYLPELPESINQEEAFKNGDKPGKMPIGGWFIVGSEGVIFNKADQAKNPQIWPLKRREEVLANPPAQTLERSPKAGNPQEEWTTAIKQGKAFPFMSQFDYSVPLTELTLVGGLAMRVAGKRIEWDPAKLEVVGLPEAQKYVKRAAYRPGYEYSAAKIS